MRNKPTLLLLILFTLGLTQKLNAQTLTGYWTLVCYSNLLTGNQDCKSITDNTEPISLEFKDNGKIGTITGHTVVNKVWGDYTILDNNKIKVERFGGTEIMEHGWGSDFMTTIYQSSSFKYSADTLVILYDNNNKAMKFLKTI